MKIKSYTLNEVSIFVLVHGFILDLTGVAFVSSLILISFSGEDKLLQDRTVDMKSMMDRRASV